MKMWNKLKDITGAVTRREVLLIALIAVMCAFFAIEGIRYLSAQQRKGEDALRENTAESVAMVNSNNGLGCPVDSCGNNRGSCAHYVNGEYIGYYDDINNAIIAQRPFGYNDYEVMTIGDETWRSPTGTMVIRVVTGDGKVKLDWERGKQ